MALINCEECGAEVSDRAPSCIKCGTPLNQDITDLESKKKTTNHILHLLLSLVSVGFWLPLWLLVVVSNSWENSSIDNKIKKLQK